MGLYKFVFVIGTSLAVSCQAHGGIHHGRSAECFEYGYDYSGYDIQNVEFVASPAACMEECALFRGCGFWTYDTFSRTCYLKSAGAFIDRKPSQGMVSGPRQCSFSPHCFEIGVDYFGNDIKKIEGRYVMTPMDCQRLCTGNPQCAFFSWKFSTHSCFLKSSSAILNRREDPDVTSGPRTCTGGPPFPPRPSDYPEEFEPSVAPPSCVEAGVEYRGHNIRTAKTKSAAGCHGQCLKLRDCHFWTWSSQTHVCALKNEGALSGRTENENTLDKVSGARNCIPVMPGCQFADVGVVGARLSTRTASAFDVCQFYCAAFSGCTHFSHHLATGECTLWSSFNAYSKGSSTQGTVSGPAFCDAEGACFEQSDYVGHNVEENETGEVESPAACQALCRKNTQCHYWTWLRNNKGCYLKDANAVLGRTNDTTSLGRFSGPKFCTVNYGCLSINATYTGVHIQHAETEDYKACSAQCGSNPFCTAWTFHSDLGLCSLFSGKATLSNKPVSGALSGTKTCGSSIEQDQSCFEDGILYSLDSIIGIGEAKSAFECFVQCQANTKCEYWSLKNSETCFFLNKKPSAFVFDPNSISGPSICPSEVPPIVRGSVDLVPMATDTVYSKAGCMNKCASTPGCQSYMLSLGQHMNCSLFESVAKSVATEKGAYYGELPNLSMLATKCTFSDQLGSVKVSTPAECLYECQADSACEAWQAKLPQAEAPQPLVTCTLFLSAQNPAPVKNPKTLCGTVALPGSLMSGVAFSEKPPTTPAGSTEGSKAFSRTLALLESLVTRQARSVGDGDRTTATDCIKKCAATKDCVAWQYTPGEQCKTLLQEAPTKKDNTSISSYFKRRTPTLLFNTSYKLPDQAGSANSSPGIIRQFAIRTRPDGQWIDVSECSAECANVPQCTAWTVSKRTCTMFSTALDPIPEENAISGRHSSVINDWEFRLNAKCVGDSASTADPPDGGSIDTAMECAGMTNAEKPDFAFKPAKGKEPSICTLYKECEPVSEEGYVCGKKRQNSEARQD